MTPNIPPVNEEMKKFIHGLLTHMVKNKGSDLFITAGYPPAMKLDGKLTQITDKPLTAEHTQQIARSIMDDKQAEEFFTTNECNFAISLAGVSRFRINAMVQRGATALVCRVITSEIPKFENMHLPPVLKQVVMEKRGLVIFVGGTGSGKSTSLAAMIGYRNANSYGHIITIEDPIEYLHVPRRSIITQREIGIDTANWEIAVQSAMRQAPDVVCVGEVRSVDSMEYALQLAQTGHLCIFTIHAATASQTIERIMNLYPEERYKQVLIDLAMNLVGIIGQRLVVKKGGKGRTAIVDLMINTPAVQDLVFKGDLMGIKDLMTRGQGDGMQTFDQHLFDLYVAGTIDYDEAIRQADSANDLRLRIQLYEEGNKTEHIFDRVSDLNLI